MAAITAQHGSLERERRSARLRRFAPPLRERERAVVVHSGARDGYQVARALEGAGRLESLVTDLYWPEDRPWAKKLLQRMPAAIGTQLLQRNESYVPSARVTAMQGRGLATLLSAKLAYVPFAWRRAMMRATDAALGKAAGLESKRSGATLLSYSYYGYHAFREQTEPGILFQLHPHPVSVRRILMQELAAHPDCAGSLKREWELALPETDFARLVEETRMAAHFFVASSFTKQTLVENGTAAERISVIPYGVDCCRFSPGPRREPSGELRLLFVGSMNQRKGIKYLLEALRLLDARGAGQQVKLTVCGRIVDGLDLFKACGARVQIRPSVSAEQLLQAYREADLFVLPSVAEGFGQVLLEALACGLPVLSTTSTAAPDLIESGVQGFVVEPGRPDLLAERIEWAGTHRDALAVMSRAARVRAEYFTWQRFRSGIVDAFENFLAAREQEASHV